MLPIHNGEAEISTGCVKVSAFLFAGFNYPTLRGRKRG